MSNIAHFPTESDRVERAEPINLEAEQALLGAILVCNPIYHRVDSFLLPKHFADPSHATIFSAIATLIGRDHLADPITLKGYLENAGELSECGGAAYLAQLAASVVTIVNAYDYGRVILDAYTRRKLIQAMRAVEANAYDATLDDSASDLVSQAETALFELGDDVVSKRKPVSIAESAASQLAIIEAAWKARQDGKDPPNIIRTRLPDLDRALGGGLKIGTQTILAGRPSMGKSALAFEIMEAVALQGIGVMVFSLEMSHTQITGRRVAAYTGISTQRQDQGDIQQHDFAALVEARTAIAQLPIWIDDQGGQTIAEIIGRARRLKRQHPEIKVMILDHMQIVTGTGKAGNRNEDLTAISGALATASKDLDVAMLTLSQLSRGVEGREDKRPDLSDLRESGAIEQDADVVAFIYREEYYLSRQEPRLKSGETAEKLHDRHTEWQSQIAKARGKAEVFIRKHRTAQAPVDIPLAFDPVAQKFRSYLSEERNHNHD